jgi:hypothetical protein
MLFAIILKKKIGVDGMLFFIFKKKKIHGLGMLCLP